MIKIMMFCWKKFIFLSEAGRLPVRMKLNNVRNVPNIMCPMSIRVLTNSKNYAGKKIKQ